MFNYNLQKERGDYELSDQLKINRIRYPKAPSQMKSGKKRQFADLQVKLAFSR